MGLLDMLTGGGGQAQQGPQSPGILGQFQAQYAPGAYAAKQHAQEQQAIYAAAMQQQGVSPQQAQALAMSPQYFQAQQGASLRQAPQVMPVTNADGSTTLVDIQGGGAQGHTLSGIPITQPGTTASPQQASQGASGQPGAKGESAPAASAGPTNTLQGMPGSSQATLDAIGKAKEAGQDPYALIPPAQRDVTKAIVDGRMTLSEIKQTRGEHIAGSIRNYVLAIDPDYNELKGEKSAAWVKSYMDTKNGDVGMSRNSLGTSLNHIRSSINNQIELKNHDANMAMLGRGDNLIRNQFGEQANKAGTQNALSSTSADELARFITGKAPSDTARKEYAEKFPNASDTPRVAAGKYEAMADLLEGRLKDMEAERDQNFGGKAVSKDYPIALPEHQKAIAEIRQKAAELRRQGQYQIQHGQGQEAPAAGGWKYIPK